MFCEIAPFSFSMESIIFTGSSRFRPEDLLSCKALLVALLLSKVLLLWLSSVVVVVVVDAAAMPGSVCLLSAAQVVLTSISAGKQAQLPSSISTISTSLMEDIMKEHVS